MPSRYRNSRAVLTVLAVSALAYSFGGVIMRALPVSNIFSLVIVVGAPYLPVIALAGFALLLLCRRLFLSIVAMAVVSATVIVQVPWYFFGQTADVGAYSELRLLSSNLRKGRIDALAFVELANASAEVITVSELTPEAVRRFADAGIEEEFPYSVLSPAPGAAGIGLWSRFPLASPPLSSPRTAMAAARLRVPRVRVDPILASIHIISPVAYDWDSVDDWRNGLAAVEEAMGEFASTAKTGAVIVAGDFNSTPDMRQFRDLLKNGYRDAVEQSGAGLSPTFPSNLRVPPVITIDHLITRRAVVSSIRAVSIPGSDHRSLIAQVRVPLYPAS